MDENKTLVDYFFESAEKNTNGVTFINDGKEDIYVSYYNISQSGMRILNNLNHVGIKKGDEVIFVFHSNEKFIKTFWGCLAGGIIPVPVAPTNAAEIINKIDKIINRLNNPYIIYDVNIDYLSTIIEKRKMENKVIAYEEMCKDNGIGEKAQVLPEDIAFLQFSSGSTGDPKGVILTHRSLVSYSLDTISQANIMQKDRFISWLPFTHDMGIVGLQIVPTILNANIYNMSNMTFIRNPLLWISKMDYYRATVTCTPNFAYKYVLNALEKHEDKCDYDLSHMRIFFNGSEPISIELCQQFLEKFSKYGLKDTAIYTVYGLAEACLGVSYPIPEQKLSYYYVDNRYLGIGNKVIFSQSKNSKNIVLLADEGYPLQHCNVMIKNENGEELSEDTVGYVCIKGMNVTPGYYNDPVNNEKKFFTDGWLNTGDLGFFHDGKLAITGRKNEIIFIGGQNYYPYDFERVVEQSGLVTNVGKIAVSSSYNKEQSRHDVIAFVAYGTSFEKFIELEKEIRKLIYQNMGIYIDLAIPVKKIPKTTSGKLQRYKLIQDYEAGCYCEVVEKIAKLKEEQKEKTLENIIVETFRKVLNDQEITIMTSLDGYDITSASIIRIFQDIDKQFPGKLTVSELFSVKNLESLCAIMKSEKNYKLQGTLLPEFCFNQEGTNGYINISIKYDTDENNAEKVKRELCGMLMYSIHRFSRQDIVNVQCNLDSSGFIHCMHGEFDQIKDLDELFEHLKPENCKLKYKISAINNMSFQKQKNGAFILCDFEGGLSASDLNKFDIIISNILHNGKIELCLQYKIDKLSHMAMKELFKEIVFNIKNYRRKKELISEC